MNTVLCTDIGTSSLKASLINSEGKVLASSRIPLILHNTRHAAREWKNALSKAADEIYGSSQTLPKADALCISGNGPTLVANGTRKTLLWNEDISERQSTSSGSPAPRAENASEPTNTSARTDNATGSPAPQPPKTKSLFIPRILAFKKKFPESWKNSIILSGPEYLIYELTGNAVTILPEARYSTAYWSDEALLEQGFTHEEISKLPPFVSPGFRAGSLKTSDSDLSSYLAEGTHVYCGAPDFVSALAGTATLSPGKLCDRAGSSEGINLCTEKPLSAQGIRTLPSVMPGLWNASFLLPRSGSRFYEYTQKVERERGCKVNLDLLVEEILYHKGNSQCGCTLTEGKDLIMRTAEEVRSAVEALKSAAEKEKLPFPSEMTITGGQSRNDAWNALKAKVTGLTVNVPECMDAELTGDAAFTFTAMGIFRNLPEAASKLCRIKKSFSPDGKA